MKKTFLLILCIMHCALCINLTAQVATISQLKSLTSDSQVLFTGELTLQYVSVREGGSDFYAFDAQGDFIRLRCYNWATLFETTQLKNGDKITITEEVTYIDNTENCVTLDLNTTAVKSVTVVGSASLQLPEVVTIEQLIADTQKQYSAKFVKLQGVAIESVIDFNVSPFPINKIVSGEYSINYSMDLVETVFPAVADVSGFVYYTNGQPALFVPQSDGYVRASAYNTVSGLKMMEGQNIYTDIVFTSKVLLTDIRSAGDNVVYVVQDNDASGQPCAVEIVMPKAQIAVGDSIMLDIVGNYRPSAYASDALDRLTSARFTATKCNEITVLSSNNPIDFISFDDVFTDKGWLKYDNCLAITKKGEVVNDAKFTSIGCIGLRIYSDVLGRYDTVPVLDTYYKEAGSLTTVVLKAFVCGIEVGAKSYAVLMPRSKTDFLKNLVEFDDIASVKKAGKSPSLDISYKIQSAMTITGFASEKFDVGTFYHIFVQDATGALQLNHQSAEMQRRYKIGDVITNVVGYYTSGGKTYNRDNSRYYASAPALDVKSMDPSASAYTATPVEVSLANLDDSYASQLITIKNITYNATNSVMLGGEAMERPTIHQGEDWTIVAEGYDYASEMGSVTGVYYLAGVLTKLIPRSQSDIVVETIDNVENIHIDNNLFLHNGVIYAQGATIEVYDIMGRIIASGIDSLAINHIHSLIIVKTTYPDNQQYITKIGNKE